MSAWIVIPMKSFGQAKSRLEAALDTAERRRMAHRLFGHVLARAIGCTGALGLAGVLVLTNGDDVAEVALEAGAEVVRDAAEISARAAHPGHLGRVVDAGLAHLAGRGATRALVIMADLPHLGTEDIAAMFERGADYPMVVAPDRDESGTNALLLGPPDRMCTCFGHEDSLSRHLEAARRAGIPVSLYRSPRVALDIDRPRDLERA